MLVEELFFAVAVPERLNSRKGNWVLYWKKIPGNPRGAKGRWHGPAQVITVENRRVVWVSHGGYLIRASPQHLRSASLREYRALPKGDDGLVRDEVIDPRTRNYHALTDIPPADHETEYEPSIAPSNIGPPSFDQPEGEISPPMSIQENEENQPEENVEETTPPNGDFGGLGVPVPEDDESDDGLCSFGDDVEGPPNKPGVWEIQVHETFEEPPASDAAKNEQADFILLATMAKKQRVEVQWKELDEESRKLFQKAKDKGSQSLDRSRHRQETGERVVASQSHHAMPVDFKLETTSPGYSGIPSQSKVGNFGF